jgi:hypothetical protein
MYLKLKQKQTKPKISRWGEVTKVRAEINEIVSKRTIQRLNKTKNWFFKNIAKSISC